MIQNQKKGLEESFGALLGNIKLSVDWRTWFHKNGLPTWRFKGYLDGSFDEDFEEWAKTEYLQHERQVHEYELLHRRFEGQGFSAILFKSCGFPTEFPYYLHGNLDVLVERMHLRKARAILDGLHYVELRHIEEPEKFLYKKFEVGKPVSEIHLHCTVGWGVPFLCDDVFWKRNHRRSKKRDFVHYPSNTDCLLITLAHTFYEDKSFSLINILRIGACLLGEVEWDYALWTAQKRGWEDGLREVLGCYVTIIEKLKLVDLRLPKRLYNKPSIAGISDRLTEYPIQYSFLTAKKYYYRKIWRDSRRTQRQKLYDIASTFCWGVEVKLNLFFQRPFVIAFSGIDGSGKTTQISALRAAFENCAIKTETIWFRCFCSPMSKFLQSIRNQKTINHNSINTKEINTSVNESTRGRIILYFEHIFATIELFYIYAIKVRYFKLFDRVVFLDRCLLDMGVELDLRYPGHPFTSSLLWRFLTWCSVSPDIHIFIDANSGVVEQRQFDESIAMLKKTEVGYQRLLDEFNVSSISAQKPINTIANNIYFKVIKNYFQNWNLPSKRILLATRRQMNPSLGEEG